MAPPKASKPKTRFNVDTIPDHIKNRVSGRDYYAATEEEPNPGFHTNKGRRVLPYFVKNNIVHYLFDPLNPVKMVCIHCGTTMSSYGNSSNHHGMDKKTKVPKTNSQCALCQEGPGGEIDIPFVWMPQIDGSAVNMNTTETVKSEVDDSEPEVDDSKQSAKSVSKHESELESDSDSINEVESAKSESGSGSHSDSDSDSATQSESESGKTSAEARMTKALQTTLKTPSKKQPPNKKRKTTTTQLGSYHYHKHNTRSK